MYSFKKIHTRIAHRSIGAKHRLMTRAVCFPSPRSEYWVSLFPLHPDQFFRALQEAIQSLARLSKATVCTAAEVPEEMAMGSGKEGRRKEVSSGLSKWKAPSGRVFKNAVSDPNSCSSPKLRNALCAILTTFHFIAILENTSYNRQEISSQTLLWGKWITILLVVAAKLNSSLNN